MPHNNYGHAHGRGGGGQKQQPSSSEADNFVFSLGHHVHTNNQQIVVKELIEHGDKFFVSQYVTNPHKNTLEHTHAHTHARTYTRAHTRARCGDVKAHHKGVEWSGVKWRGGEESRVEWSGVEWSLSLIHI